MAKLKCEISAAQVSIDLLMIGIKNSFITEDKVYKCNATYVRTYIPKLEYKEIIE